MVVLLGEADVDPKHQSLRHTPEADAQAAAKTLHAPFNWSRATVPGVEHSNQGMAPFAVQHLHLSGNPLATKP